MKNNKGIRLLHKYLYGKPAFEEKAKVEKWYEDINENGDVAGSDELLQIKEQIYQRTWDKLNPRAKVIPFYKKPFFRVAAAAVVAVCITSSYFLFLSKSKPSATIAKTHTLALINDVAAPDANKAILTLGNGKRIVLDSAANGSLAQQGNAVVSKLNNGKIAYNADNNVAAKIQYNTLTVPKGSKPVQLVLADGSEVWLDVASSITYPTAFAGKERNVEITGEAYFEVAHDANRPFRVKAGNTVVQVLGTHFNVNAYGDDAEIKTTLLQGMVKVITANADLTITPGEQAVTSIDQPGIKMNKDVDLDEVIAWKEGLFNFNDANLKTVMRQLSRWYDVNVIYQGDIPERQFGGEMQRNLNLSQVLLLLQKNNIHFRIEGKNLIVTP